MMSTVARIIFSLPIHAYRLILSPILGPRCRYAPSCSEYTLLAIQKHGAWRGFWLSLARIQRCRPGGASGFDPPPDALPDQGWRFWRYGDWKGPPPESNRDKTQ